MRIGIIGGGGHVGLPTGLVFADNGNTVVLIDTDEQKLEKIADGEIPFQEPGAKQLLERNRERVELTQNVRAVEDCDAVILVVGTPIDEHNNPQMDNLLGAVEKTAEYLTTPQTIILRSTVYPGTTQIVCDTLSKKGFTIGEDVFVSFAPERVAQHKAIEEIRTLPQLIGAPDEESYRRTEQLFDPILESDCLQMTPTEAELGKLFTNMWRYLTFAAANEFYMIADSFADRRDVNVHRILEKTQQDYPRFDAPSPGSNVGGPCLTKDGWFLTDNIPFNELVSTSYQINEGMPTHIINRMQRSQPDPEKVTVLGMTFKRNSDDLRNSVSFNLVKKLRRKGFDEVVQIEPNCEGFDDWNEIEGSEWVILMTPHSVFEDFDEIRSLVDNPECLYCDIWGHWEEVKYQSDNGYWRESKTSEERSTVTELRQ